MPDTIIPRLDLRGQHLSLRELKAALPRAEFDVEAALDAVRPIVADVASPPLPVDDGTPVPMTVLIAPPTGKRRTRLLRVSVTTTRPSVSSASASGVSNVAAVAGPPSPLNPVAPVPAIVVIVPVVAATKRMRFPPVSATYRLPAPSTATPCGECSRAAVAGPPSPVEPDVPLPATVVMMPVPTATLRMRWW